MTGGDLQWDVGRWLSADVDADLQISVANVEVHGEISVDADRALCTRRCSVVELLGWGPE